MNESINICPSTLACGYSEYSPRARKILFDGQNVSPWLDFAFERDLHIVGMAENMGKISLSGVEEKFSAVVDNGKIRLTNKGEQGRYILKPAPLDFGISTRKQIPANEHVTMQLASQVYGVITAANGMCFASDGQLVYITRRFDIGSDGKKIQQEDFASLLGRNEQVEGSYFKYEGCYADMARAIKHYVPAWQVSLERFFSLVVFNYIYANGDAHLKNFSLQNVGGEYVLAPAYDLLNTSLHIDGDDFGLNGGLSPEIEKSDVYERTGHPCRLDFMRFGEFIGLKARRIEKILNLYVEFPPLVHTLIANSFLNEKMKRNYLRLITERQNRFIRKSED